MNHLFAKKKENQLNYKAKKKSGKKLAPKLWRSCAAKPYPAPAGPTWPVKKSGK
jgi:hypothetical protein